MGGHEACAGELAKEEDPEESSWSFESEAGIRYMVASLVKVNRTALKSAKVWPCLWKRDVGNVAQRAVDESLAQQAASPAVLSAGARAATEGTEAAEASNTGEEGSAN